MFYTTLGLVVSFHILHVYMKDEKKTWLLICHRFKICMFLSPWHPASLVISVPAVWRMNPAFICCIYHSAGFALILSPIMKGKSNDAVYPPHFHYQTLIQCVDPYPYIVYHRIYCFTDYLLFFYLLLKKILQQYYSLYHSSPSSNLGSELTQLLWSKTSGWKWKHINKILQKKRSVLSWDTTNNTFIKLKTLTTDPTKPLWILWTHQLR